MKKLTKYITLLGLSTLLLLTVGCEKKKVEKEDFASLMGKETSLWQHVQTKEDHSLIDYFENIYLEAQKRDHYDLDASVPKTIHFIWVGPKQFPENSKKNVETWVQCHPDWKVKFWTDRVRPLPHPKMEMIKIGPEHFDALYTHFKQSTNYAEKSDLLRYEVLRREGGVYVDHDVVCYKSFQPLIDQHQFFCALEPPHKPIAKTSISVCNNIIASIPHHPVLERCIQKVEKRWDQISELYPGEDKESIIYRVFHRTFCPFDEAVYELATKSSHQDVIFPAGYFNRLEGQYALFANHEYVGMWYNTEDPYETLVRRRLMKMSKKMNKILLICGTSVALNFIMCVGIIFALRKRKYAHES